MFDGRRLAKMVISINKYIISRDRRDRDPRPGPGLGFFHRPGLKPEPGLSRKSRPGILSRLYLKSSVPVPKIYFYRSLIIFPKLGMSKRLFKSLVCIVLFSLLGFVPNTIYYAIGRLLGIPNFWHPDTLISKILLDLSDDLALISCCSNAVILITFRWENIFKNIFYLIYKFSGEYRRAFCTYLPFLGYFIKNNSQNTSIDVQLQNNRQIHPVSNFHGRSSFAMTTWPGNGKKQQEKNLQKTSDK